jgi:hypothetical protein
VSTQFDSGSELVREVRINRGVMTSRMAAQETRTYTLRNVDATAKTLVIEQLARPRYNLVKPDASEKTVNAYRFEVKLGPDSSTTFAVTEERVYETTTAVATMSSDAIVAISQNKALSQAARQQLEQVISARGRVANLESELRNAEQPLKDLGADQERVRRNIATLNAVAGQQDSVQQHARQLSALEAQLARQRDRRANLERQLKAARQQLNQLIASLSF